MNRFTYGLTIISLTKYKVDISHKILFKIYENTKFKKYKFYNV